MSSLPPIINSPLFNSSYFNSSDGYLTLTTGDQRYLRLGGVGTLSALNVIGNLDCGSLTIGGAALDLSGLSYVSGITAGTAQASKALVLDSGKAITGITSISSTSITGTLTAGGQPNITSLGILTSILSVSTTATNGVSISNSSAAAQANIKFTSNLYAGEIGVRGSSASNPNTMYFYHNGAFRMFIDSTGNVGIGTLPSYQLDLGGSGTGINTGSLKLNGTTFDQSLYLSITQGGAAASKAVVLNSTLDYSGINNLGCSILTASTSMASPAITVDTINTSAGLNINYTNLKLNGSAMTSTAAKLNYNDITTLGAFQVSKTMTLDSSGVGLMPLGTSSTNCFRFYGNTANRETMNIYRVSDTNGLVIASRTTSRSNNKTYPVLIFLSTDNPSSFVGGVSATSADLCNINWNDKPSVGFTSQTHKFCFNVGNSQPYKSGFPHTYTLATSADAFCINLSGSSPTPTSGCLYLVSDTVNKMIFNTNTPYTSSFGTAPLTLNSGNVYIKASNALNDGTANYDMPIFMESSNASPIEFGLLLSNATNATSTNSAYFGTTTTNDLVLMTGNTRRLTITSAGRVGIGTGSPNAPLQVAGSNSSITIIPVSTISYSYDVASNAWANRGGGPFTLTNISASFGGNIYIQAGIWATSDRRLKENIKQIDLPFDRYKDLKPVSYSYKNEAKKRVGLIAQDVMRVCSEAITMIENQNLKDEGENSPEGVQLCLDYNAITILNVNIFKKLIDRIEKLESTIKKIVAIT